MTKFSRFLLGLMVHCFLCNSPLHAQSVFQPQIQAQSDVGRYNAKGERLSNRSPKHVLDNADKTHFTFTQWAEKIEEAKNQREKQAVAGALIGIATNLRIRFPDQDKSDMQNAVAKLLSSDDPIARSSAIEIIMIQFERDFQRELIEASKDASPNVKYRAFRALSRHEVRGLNDVYGEALLNQKEHRLVRLQSANSLANRLRLGDESTVEHLENGIRANRRDKEIVKVIEDALAKHYARTN